MKPSKTGVLASALLLLGVVSFLSASVFMYCPSDMCVYNGCSACMAAYSYEEISMCCFNCTAIGTDPLGKPPIPGYADVIVYNWPEGISVASCCGQWTCYPVGQ